jgi:hypothetical protein
MINQKFEVTNVVKLLNVTTVVEIGSTLEVECEIQICCRHECCDDWDWIDVTKAKYMGVAVDNWKECVTYHKSLGIDLNSRINEELTKIFNEDVLNLIVKNN